MALPGRPASMTTGKSSGYSSDAWLYSNGTMTDLGIFSAAPAAKPTASTTTARSSAGPLVVPANISHAFLYSNGTMQDLGILPGGLQSSRQRHQ